MLPTEPACLVMADISGYTSYLAGVELDHAQDILADLTDVVVRSLRPTLRLAKLEGDAAFAYVVGDSIDGSMLQDAVEHCYVAFRRRLRDIGQASQCDCNACTRMPNLDLKFVLHHGVVARQRMAGREELVGRDVIVVHRLLKNGVRDALGFGAYALYTAECVRAMGLVDPAAAGLWEHHETYEVVGDVTGWVRDLGAVWREADSRAAVQVNADQAAWSTSYDLPAPPPVVWEWLTSPTRRPTWQAGVTAVHEASAGGRRGVGTTNHCIHGRDAIVEEILAWQPPELFTVRDQLPIPEMPKFVLSETLEPIAGGTSTRVTVRVARPANARDRGKLEQIRPLLVHSFEESIGPLRVALEAEMAARAAAAALAPEEPEVLVPARRFLRVRG